MRSMFLSTLALTSLLALPSYAQDSGKKQAPAKQEASATKVRCAVHSKDGSRAVQGQDLILKAGDNAKDAVAVDGNVLIRKGAVVDDAIAIRGKVIIEEGAVVKGDVVAVGGDLHLQKNAKVEGDAVALGGSLQLAEGASIGGDKVTFSLNVNGEDLARSFIQKALENSDCQITAGSDEDEGDEDQDE
jgi:UDP-3-O-[3-hydroxymyristoyl] glucosamine N-acyltransferase